MPSIRSARERDAGRLAELAERTFRDAFAAMNDPEDMRLHCAAHYGEKIQAAQILDPSLETLLCEEAGELIGYVQLRWGPAPGDLKAMRPVEILRLYVAEAWHGRGAAQDLMSAALDRAANGGADLVWLGVWERNPRGIAFYRKCGFAEAGDHVFLLGTDPQRDLLMIRAIESAAPTPPPLDAARRRG